MKAAVRSLLRDEDKQGIKLFLVAALVSIVAVSTAVLAFDVWFWEAVAFLGLPVVVLGYADMALDKKWIPLLLAILVPLVLLAAGWKAAFIGLAVFPGSAGVSAMADAIDRALLPKVLDSVEHCNTSPSGKATSRISAFFFSIPADYDARNMFVNDSIRREGILKAQVIRIAAPAFLLLILLWMFIAGCIGVRIDVGTGAITVSVACLYISAIVAPWTVLMSVDARVVASGSVFRLYDGFYGTIKRMVLPLMVALAIIAFVTEPGWNALKLALVSIVVCASVLALALVKFSQDEEPELVSDLAESWSSSHPVDFYSGFDGRDGRHPLDDGVPGTPRRPADSCFLRQKY